jgi:hypothetical protein
MTVQKNNTIAFFDDIYSIEEQLPRKFIISFNESEAENKKVVKVLLNDNIQVGDIIDDNAYENDYYRYHDIFHYTYATILGWSPCTRAMMKCKRKSNSQVDKIEDGARATITEEALSMIIFNEAKKKDFFENKNKISKNTLKIIKEMTESFEVRVRTESEWQNAIFKAYEMFRLLVKNAGGKVSFNAINKEISFMSVN